MNRDDITKLYDGAVTLEFEERKHRYRATDEAAGLDRAVVPNVTSIIKCLPNDMKSLDLWGARLGADAFRASVAAGEVLSADRIDELARVIYRAHTIARDLSCFIGNQVHDYCEGVINYKLGERDEPPVRVFKESNVKTNLSIGAFAEWTKTHRIEFLASEKKVYHRTIQYTGTMDIDAIVDGQRCVVDIKTGKHKHKTYLAQVAAYAHAHECEHGHMFDGAWIVIISRESGELQTIHIDREQLDSAFQIFMAANAIRMTFDAWKKEVGTWRKGIRY